MSNINHDYIENYIEDLLPSPYGLLKDLKDYADVNNIPIVTLDVASLIEIIVKSAKVRSILEIGTAIGYSSILMGKAIGRDFKITTIEKDPSMVEIARKNIEKADYSDEIEVIQGDALEVLDDIHGTYDMIFLDAAKGHYQEVFDKSIARLKVGGLFLCDNVLFRGMVAERSLVIRRKITIVKRLKKFLPYISDHEALQTSIVPIGDGLSISLKLKEVTVQ